jgi:hypothetical protein
MDIILDDLNCWDFKGRPVADRRTLHGRSSIQNLDEPTGYTDDKLLKTEEL